MPTPQEVKILQRLDEMRLSPTGLLDYLEQNIFGKNAGPLSAHSTEFKIAIAKVVDGLPKLMQAQSREYKERYGETQVSKADIANTQRAVDNNKIDLEDKLKKARAVGNNENVDQKWKDVAELEWEQARDLLHENQEHLGWEKNQQKILNSFGKVHEYQKRIHAAISTPGIKPRVIAPQTQTKFAPPRINPQVHTTPKPVERHSAAPTQNASPKKIMPEQIQDGLDRLAFFADSYFVAIQHGGDETKDEHYKKLNAKQQSMLRVLLGAASSPNCDVYTPDGYRELGKVITDFTKNYPMEGKALGIYLTATHDFLSHRTDAIDKGVVYLLAPPNPDGFDDSEIKRWKGLISELTPTEKKQWEDITRQKGLAAVTDGPEKIALKKMIAEDLAKQPAHNDQKKPEVKKAPPTQQHDPEGDEGSPFIRPRKLDGDGNTMRTAPNTKKVALHTGLPAKSLGRGKTVDYAVHGSLKGKVAKSNEHTLTALPVPELAAAAVAHKQSPRSPGLNS